MSTASVPLAAKISVALQWLLPTRLLSSLVHWLAHREAEWLKNLLIRRFAAHFRIDMQEAKQEALEAYPHFNAFFTRALKPGARPLPPASTAAVVSPVDGTVSEFGKIDAGRIIQAKGSDYTAESLLGMPATPFEDGDFCTIYLAPHNYHRIHAPDDITLRGWQHLPGRLFSVNPATVMGRPRLFARNERVVALFDTSRGPLAMVMVGALLVGSVDTVWAGRISPPHYRRKQPWRAATANFARGDELGRFNMGSTVILLAAAGVLSFDKALRSGSVLRMGEIIAQPTPERNAGEN